MKNVKRNINNLTHLWALAGQAFQGFEEKLTYTIAKINNTEWPNRIWSTSTLSEESLKEIGLKMKEYPELTFSCFNEIQEDNSLETQHLFALKSLQYGMSLPLNGKNEIKRELECILVDDEAKALLWSTAFSEAFGYQIATNVVVKTCDDVRYFLIYDHGNIVGTVMLVITNNVAGIHSLGIIPAQRKKGYAWSIMQHVLNKAIDLNCDIATLQASEMAKNMYLKMGFTVDFLMQNYTLKQ